MNDRTNGAPAGSGAADHAPESVGGAEPSGRSRTRAEERIAALDTSTSGLTRQLDELRAELALAQQEAGDNKAGWQRSAADFSNYRRRTEQERVELLGLAGDALLLKVLALADDFDRAMEHVPADSRSSPWVEGVAAIDRKVRQLLESEGVTALETVGRPFDPHQHQAISHEETDAAPDGAVLRELQRGYRVRDRILRPALVAVALNETSTTPRQHDNDSDARSGDDRE